VADASGKGGPDRPWDAGLQPERTSLAWVRTALGFVGVSLLTARLAAEAGPVALVVALAGTVVSALLVWMQAHRHPRRDRALRGGEPVPAPIASLAATLLTVVLAATSLVLVAVAALRG
jgi:uncharacterized membrane protein YidH (DUF202 family)